MATVRRLALAPWTEERIVPRYYMHLVDGHDVLLDLDGVELAADKVADCALDQARDCMAGDVHDGRLDLR